MGHNRACFILCALLLPGFPVKTSAQEPLSAKQMGFSDLVAQADYALQNNNPAAAVPLLKEVIFRAGSLTANDAKASVQKARLHLGQTHLNLGQWNEARQCVKDYLSHEPIDDRMAALQILCQIDLAAERWNDLEISSRKMLADPGERLKTIAIAQRFLLKALFHLEKYPEALAMLPEVIAQIEDPNTLHAYRLMQLRCQFETGRIDEMIASLPVLLRGNSRNDVALNLTLLHMGDRLFDRQQYRKALVIYRMVTPKEELLHQQEKLLAEAGKSIISLDHDGLRKTLDMLRSVPDYDIHIGYRAAQIYSEQKRFWEAVVLFDQLHINNPDKEEGRSAFFQKLLLLYTVGADDEAVSESVSYLEKNTSGFYPRMICTRLVQYYLQKQKLREALALSRYIDRWSKPENSDELEQETELLYLMCFARFQLGEYDEAYQAFDRVIRIAPKSAAAMESNYWKAMCRLLQQNYTQAYEQFMAYRKAWPNAGFAPAALFRAGVCLFGQENYDGAKTHFKTFIDTYPADPLMPEALSMYGDLLGADGQLPDALAQYDRAFQIVAKNYAVATDPVLKAQIPLPATYAVFQAAQALSADAESLTTQKESAAAQKAYRQIIERTQLYMKTFGSDSDWAKAVFWIGKAQIALGEPDKAVKAYLDTIVRYGADPAQEGVTAILFELSGIIKNRQNQAQREQTVQAIRTARATAKSLTLQIRLDVLLAELDGTQDALGLALLERKPDLSVIPPSGLALMCRALLNQQNFSRSEEFFNLFAQHHETSPYRVIAFQLRAEALYRQQQTNTTYALANEALTTYGATADTGWAQLMKGKIELARGEYGEAVKTLNVIPTVRVWRGPIAAEAMLRLGEAWEMQKNYEKAFAFYQRTYLLYKAHDNGRWAADGYLRSAQCLRKMGRVSAARNTYRAMLLDEYVRNLPQAQTAKEALGPAETAELLAGRTNTMESVEGEKTP
jgi:tetratricopeptide (TPR) repeat protein